MRPPLHPKLRPFRLTRRELGALLVVFLFSCVALCLGCCLGVLAAVMNPG